jgi:hypothetical protein
MNLGQFNCYKSMIDREPYPETVVKFKSQLKTVVLPALTERYTKHASAVEKSTATQGTPCLLHFLKIAGA